jgi:hypothetical protein
MDNRENMENARYAINDDTAGLKKKCDETKHGRTYTYKQKLTIYICVQYNQQNTKPAYVSHSLPLLQEKQKSHINY